MIKIVRYIVLLIVIVLVQLLICNNIQFSGYIMLNPLYWVINQFRCFIYQGIVPNGINLINLLLISLIILICGIIVFKKYGDKVVTKF